MNKGKILLVFGCLLGSIGLFVGCTDKKETVESEEIISSSSTIESTTQKTEETSQSTEVEEEIQMDFTQIKKGDYGSLLGEWVEIAVSGNNHDAMGSQWKEPQGGTLTVSQNEITNGFITLVGDILKESEDQPVTFQEKEYLTANSSGGAVIYSVFFYPKGVELSDFGEDVPETIKTDTDRIIIRSSSSSYVQVFERRTVVKPSEKSDEKSKSSIAKASLEMDIKQIEKGDFSSVNGVWKNGRGAQIVVNNDVVEFSDVIGMGEPEPAIMTNLFLNLINSNAPDGSPALQKGWGDTEVPKYTQDLRTQMMDGYVSLASTLPGAILYISFLPEGVAGDIQDGDASREKIVAIGTQNNPTMVMNEHVYYRVD